MRRGSKERVLVLDPDDRVRAELAAEVEALGYQVDAVSDVELVLLRLSRAQYPLIVVGPKVEATEVVGLGRRAQVVQPDVILVTADAKEDRVCELSETLREALLRHAHASAQRFVDYIAREPVDNIFRILVMDPDEGSRSMMRALLSAGAAHDVLECQGFDSALELAGAWDPDVMLLGIHENTDAMLAALVMLRRRRSDVPLVVVTDEGDSRFALRAIQVGAQEVLARGRITQETLRHTLWAAVERRLARDRLHFLEHFHPLTGLPNQRALDKHLAEAMSESRPDGGQVGLLMFNLDRFNAMNLSLGPEGGDEIIQLVADRMRSVAEEDEIMGHLGGDEFAVVVRQVGGLAHLQRRARDFIGVTNDTFTIGGRDYLVTMSAGVATYPESKSAEALFQHASRAMRRAKRGGRNQIAFFHQVESHWSPEQIALEGDLAAALRESQFELFYQPKLGLPEDRTIGSEALLRWRHPQRGVVYPDKFIPLLEETGLIVQVGRWALTTACSQTKTWHDMGHRVSVAINVSARQFRSGELTDHVRDALKISGLDPSYLELELTESLLLDDADYVMETLLEIRSLGVKLSMDDFGTGYSSLAYLKRYPMDILKIDRSFLMDITQNDEDLEIVRAIIDMAHTLGLSVTAEGVETEEQLGMMIDACCDHYQGYLASRPIEHELFTEWLQGAERERGAA